MNIINKFKKNYSIEKSINRSSFFMKNYIKKICGILLCIMFVFAISNINIELITSLQKGEIVTMGNLKSINNLNSFGKIIKSQINESTVSTGSTAQTTTTMTIKLFGFIPIKKVEVVVCPDKSVYLGGIPLGFSLSTKGVIVVGQNSVITKDGRKTPEKSTELRNGDILLKVNNIDILDATKIREILNEGNGENLTLTLDRNGKIFTSEIKPVFDVESNQYKLGIWIRDEAQGIGTLTFMTEDNCFGALGHPICDYETGAQIPVNSGDVYNCSTLGITKGTKGSAGELRCLFVQGNNSKGNILKNTNCGVFGKITDKEKIIDQNLQANIGTRMVAKIGEAKLISAVSGIREEYDIEIIKTYHQQNANDKSFVFRVKDKRLIELTGGIVQGMSGSPIVQDGKLIGAVTHVFLYDPTKGYGVYAEWMLKEIENM